MPSDLKELESPCPLCNGSGILERIFDGHFAVGLFQDTCPICDGSGRVQQKESCSAEELAKALYDVEVSLRRCAEEAFSAMSLDKFNLAVAKVRLLLG